MNIAADKISDSEVEVMKAVWNNDEPVTYAQIRASLKETGWESATVNTFIKRLVNKGVLKQVKKDVYYYSSIISETALYHPVFCNPMKETSVIPARIPDKLH